MNDENDSELVDYAVLKEEMQQEMNGRRIDLSYERSCDGCTKCCEGWLSSNIYGYPMYRGRGCQFVQHGKGCAIYDKRPEDPCKLFLCSWRTDLNIPEWMKPSNSNAICMWKTTNDDKKISFLHIIECDNKLDSDVLSWLIDFAGKNSINYAYNLNGQIHYVGSEEFITAVNQ